MLVQHRSDSDSRTIFQELLYLGNSNRQIRTVIQEKTGKNKRRWNMARLFADETCGEAILDYLGKVDVGTEGTKRRSGLGRNE